MPGAVVHRTAFLTVVRAWDTVRMIRPDYCGNGIVNLQNRGYGRCRRHSGFGFDRAISQDLLEERLLARLRGDDTEFTSARSPDCATEEDDG